MSDYPGKFGEVCKHKILMRSCEICELESRLAEKEKVIERLTRVVKEMRDHLYTKQDIDRIREQAKSALQEVGAMEMNINA